MTDRRVDRVARPGGPAADVLAVEEPLEIRVEERALAVTLRTPGHDRELAAGFLVSQGILERPDDLQALEPLAGDPHGNTVVARVAGGVEAHADAIRRASRDFFATSACGICGVASLDAVARTAPPLPPPPEPAPGWLEGLRLDGPLFAATHGVHAAALVGPDGVVEVLREDIGRHNAVDKVVGHRFLAGRVPIRDRALVVSGRAGFEIVWKARVAGIGTVVAVGAASTLSVDLARSAGMILVGFLRDAGWTRYA